MLRAWGPPCHVPLATLELAPFLPVTVHAKSVGAWKCFAALCEAHNYDLRHGETGGYNCRHIAGTEVWSLHSVGVAIDVNWNDPDMPIELVHDIEALRVRDGRPAFRWGGRFMRSRDPMHWEIAVEPGAL